jgi:hypothetical protein
MVTAGSMGEDVPRHSVQDATFKPFTEEEAAAIFYNCCSAKDAAWAAARLEPEPALPVVTPSEVTWERWGRIARDYIECSQDLVLSLERQKMIQAAAPCDPVVRLNTDHSPFLSAPEDLCHALVKVAHTWNEQ